MFTYIKDLLDWITTNINSAIAAGIAIATLYGFIYKIGKKAKAERDRFLALFDLPDKIDEIAAQLRTNGGSTLKDAVNRIEQRQRREAEKTRLLLEGGDFPCFECDASGACLYVNQAYMKLVERDEEEEVLYNNWRALISEEDREDVLSNWDRAIKDKTNFEAYFSFVGKENTRIPVYCRAYTVKDSNQNVIGWLGILRAKKKK
jgi:PAS domain-containing protein